MSVSVSISVNLNLTATHRRRLHTQTSAIVTGAGAGVCDRNQTSRSTAIKTESCHPIIAAVIFTSGYQCSHSVLRHLATISFLPAGLRQLGHSSPVPATDTLQVARPLANDHDFVVATFCRFCCRHKVKG